MATRASRGPVGHDSPSPDESGHHSTVGPVGAFRPITWGVGHHQVRYAPLVCPEGVRLVMVLFLGHLGRTSYPGSSHERLLPVATRPHTDVRLTPPLAFSGEDIDVAGDLPK